MNKYLAYDGINCEYEDFSTIEEAREWLEECFFEEGGYHPDLDSCKIFELKETVSYDVVDSKDNYKYAYEDDMPEGGDESEVWPYSTDFDEIWKHKFVPVGIPDNSLPCKHEPDMEFFNMYGERVCKHCKQPY